MRVASVAFRAAVAPVALTMVALAIGGCDSGDDPDTAGPSGEPQSDVAQIKKLIRDAAQDFFVGDGTSYCAKLAPNEQRDLMAFATTAGYSSQSCEQALARISRATKAAMRNKPVPSSPRTSRVIVKGESATAFVTNEGAPDAKRLELTKADGSWKLTDAGIVANPLAEN